MGRWDGRDGSTGSQLREVETVPTRTPPQLAGPLLLSMVVGVGQEEQMERKCDLLPPDPSPRLKAEGFAMKEGVEGQELQKIESSSPLHTLDGMGDAD